MLFFIDFDLKDSTFNSIRCAFEVSLSIIGSAMVELLHILIHLSKMMLPTPLLTICSV
jgi:hypothetical protein